MNLGPTLLLLQITVLLVLLVQVRAVCRQFREHRTTSNRLTSLKAALGSLLPKPLATWLATELFLLGYALGGFTRVTYTEKQFTMHKKSGWTLMALALAVLAIPETVIVHLLVGAWSQTAAWILSVLTVYGILWLVGDANAIRHLPIEIRSDGVLFRLGLRSECFLPMEWISEVRSPSLEDQEAEDLVRFSLLGNPNLVVVSTRETVTTNLLGSERKVRRIALTLDEPVQFREALQRVHTSNSEPQA